LTAKKRVSWDKEVEGEFERRNWLKRGKCYRRGKLLLLKRERVRRN